MGNQRDRQFTLPKNIRQIGNFGDTYKIYVEDFVYTYVHRTLHMEKQKDEIAAAVLLGKTFRRGGQEYVFISGAQQVSFQEPEEEAAEMMNMVGDGFSNYEETGAGSSPDREVECEFGRMENDSIPASAVSTQQHQQAFWERVYQGIKEYFSDKELLGWYFNLDGDNLEISTSLQQFFDATQEHGSRFLYFEDRLTRQDAFFVQEQQCLQRIEGYAVYYEKNPAMQEFLVAQNRHTEPPRMRDDGSSAKREDVAQNYRAILNKLNEKNTKKKRQPFVYAAGVAVLAVVAATGITQVGNYQNLKTLEQTLQTVSGNIQGRKIVATDSGSEEKSNAGQEGQTSEMNGAESSSEAGTGENAAGNGSSGASQISEKASDSEKAQETENKNASQQAENQNKTKNKTESTNQTEEKQNPEKGSQATADQKSTGKNQVNTDQSSENKNQANTSQKTESENQTDTSQKEADKNTQETNAQGSRHYTVKKGDSLMSISKAVYHNTKMIPEICSLNQIENMDMIYEGQELILP